MTLRDPTDESVAIFIRPLRGLALISSSIGLMSGHVMSPRSGRLKVAQQFIAG
jgi:hypothetical protein